MNLEAEFNTIASENFAREYERETGQLLRFRRLGDPFPDAILETTEHVEIGLEFVSVVLPFVWQEEEYFHKYRQRILEALRRARPRYKRAGIRLQPSSKVVEGPRPYRFPDVDGAEGKKLIAEFCDLLAQHFDTLHATLGLLIERIAPDAKRAFPTLLKYFDAIAVWDINEGDPRKSHPEDPIIESPTVIYRGGELAEAVGRSLTTKARKGHSYKTDFLVLHTLKTPGKHAFPEPAMSAGWIEALARELLAEERELNQRFKEIWFLNAYTTEGRRLYRLN